MVRLLFLALVVASAASASSSVTGTVVDPYGQSFMTARVRLLNPADQKILYETDVSQGTFRIEPIAPQSYFVIIRAQGFMEYTDGVSVAQGQAADMGRLTLRIGLVVESRFENRGIAVVPAPGAEPSPTPPLPEPEFVDAHVRILAGVPVMTVCEYLDLRSQAPLSYSWVGVTIIGILERTPQGSFLRQSCRDSLRSGDHSWPNAIALEEIAGSVSIPGRPNWVESLHPTRPMDEELDSRDRKAHWAAFFGRLQTREKLVAVPCGDGKQCAYGFGAISAPARLLYRKWYDFGATD